MASYRIEITSPGRPPISKTLQPGITTIGRSADNGIVLDDPLVSRRHLEVDAGNTEVRVRDVGSANGTKINGTPLPPNEWRIVQRDDSIELGTSVISVQASLEPDEEQQTVLRDAAERTAILTTIASPIEPPLDPAPPPVTAAAQPLEVEGADEVPTAEPAGEVQADSPPPPSTDQPQSAALGRMRGTFRTPALSIALLVLAALLSFPTAVAAWQQNTIMNHDGFLKLGNAVLSKDAVQRELARELSNVIGSTDQLLSGLQLDNIGQVFTSLLGLSNGGSGSGSTATGASGATGSNPANNTTGASGSDLNSILNSILGDSSTGSSGAAPSSSGPASDSLDSLFNSLLGDTKTPTTGASGASGAQGSTTQQLDSVLNAILGSSGASASANGSAGPADNTLAGLIQPIALAELKTLPNTEISNLALDEVHHTLTIVVQQDQPDRVVLNLDQEIDRILAQMGIPVKTADIGPSLGDVLVIDRHDLPFTLQVMRFFDGTTYYFLGLTVLCLVAALYFAADRARTLMYGGVALAASAVLWVLLAKFAFGPWSTSQVEHNRSARDAIKASYDVIAGTFVHQELFVIGAGLAIAVVGFLLLKGGPLSRSSVSDNQGGTGEL